MRNYSRVRRTRKFVSTASHSNKNITLERENPEGYNICTPIRLHVFLSEFPMVIISEIAWFSVVFMVP